MRRLPRKIKLRVWARDHGKCFYCKKSCRDKPTVDHVKPLVYGGTHDIDNLVTACRECNFKKSLNEVKMIVY